MVTIEHISKKYGKKEVLSDVSFQAKPGDKVGIIGRNGCGKTTLIKIMAGILKPNAGKLDYFGKHPLENKKEFGRLCGYVPQDNPLLEELSVKDNLQLWGQKKAIEDEGLLKMFQLKELLKTRVSELSGGMKRRVSIACAVCKWPPILLMDEPTTSVDIYYKTVIRDWMEEYLSMNGIIIMSTHDEQEILNCSRRICIQDGRARELEPEEQTVKAIFEIIKNNEKETTKDEI